MKKAIYALSGDPITFGHINIVERGLNVFDHILVGIGINPSKNYTFSLKEREKLTLKALHKFGEKVSVRSYSGLLADFAYENQIKTIIRGVRNSQDFGFEHILTDINHGFETGLDTHILISEQRLSHISSSAVKELQKNQANNIQKYVPLIVKEALERKISKQLLIGVTGGIGCGKTFITRELLKLFQTISSVSISAIDMDEIGRYILKESMEELHIKIREKICDKFQTNLFDENKFIKIDELIRMIFGKDDSHRLRREILVKDDSHRLMRGIFEGIMVDPLMHMLRRELRQKQGIVLINSALFVESSICDFVNNNIISVECPYKIREERLLKRGYNKEEIGYRIEAQKSTKEHISEINKLIEESRCGKLIRVQNDQDYSESVVLDVMKTLSDMYRNRWANE